MLTAIQLAQLRRDANRLLPDTADIYPREMTDDQRGGQVASWPTLRESVACRLSATSVRGRSKDDARGGRIQPAEHWIVSLPVETVIGEADRLEINGTLYEIVSSADRRSFDVNLRLICKRV